MRGIRWGVLVCAVGLVGSGDDAPVDTEGGDASSSTGPSPTTGTTGTTVDPDTGTDSEDLPDLELYDFAGGCYTVVSDDGALTRDGSSYAFSGGGTAFRMQAATLGEYLLYDPENGYVMDDMSRQTTLDSDVTLIEDGYVSGAIWALERSEADPTRYQFRNRRTDAVMQAGPLSFEEASGCADYPELTLDAEGTIQKTTFDDGTLYGIVDTHSHILSNFGFGGGGIFHGGPFHPLGVEHALPDCSIYHGENGRRDFFGFAFDTAGADGTDLGALLPAIAMGELPEDNHVTDGYPEFTEWPSAPTRSTHQMQYYKWLERSWMGGLRLVVQHATTNSIICHLTIGQGAQESRYDCEDMTAVDRIIDDFAAGEKLPSTE